MTTLIFSCSTGEGHNSAARAIKGVYDLHGKDSAVVDALSVFPEKAEKRTRSVACSPPTYA